MPQCYYFLNADAREFARLSVGELETACEI